MNAHKLILLTTLCAALGCATTTGRHGPTINARATSIPFGFETKTLYSCTGNSGSQVVFSKGKFFVSAMVRTGVIWVKPHSAKDTSGTNPTSPIPSANSIADGWVRLGDNQAATWGTDPQTTQNETSPPVFLDAEQIGFLDIWCETQGDLLAIAH